MSHAFSDRAPQPKSYVGIGLVVALHLVAIYALGVGLTKPPPHEREIATLKPLPPDVVRDPPPPEPLRPKQPVLREPEVILVPPPIFDIAVAQDKPLVSVAPMRDEPGPTATVPGTAMGIVTPPQQGAKPQVQAPGAVCSVMPRPEVPAVAWSGEAVLQVLATVRGGRVVGSDFRVLQGAMDGKTRRALQRSVESALAGYQCQSDAMFQQDFAFRLD